MVTDMAKHDLQTLAMKHLTRHKNDKSGNYLSRMNRRYGRAAAQKALDEARQIMKLMGNEPEPENTNTGRWVKPPNPQNLQGLKAQISILDDFSDQVKG